MASMAALLWAWWNAFVVLHLQGARDGLPFFSSNLLTEVPPGTATFYDTPHHEHNEIHVPTLHHEHNETHAPTNQVEQENMVMNVGRANLVDEANHDRSNPSFEGVGSAHETAVPPAANPDRAPTSSSSTVL